MFRKITIVLCIVICLFCTFLFVIEILEKKEGESFYQNVFPSNNEIDINKFKKQYKNMKGYIEFPNTNISYPIMQGNDNSYYLNHLPNGENNKMGSIYLDYRNDGFDDQNTVIYGHNFNDGTMFSDLLKLDYNKTKNYQIYTENEVIKVEIIGGYIADATKSVLPIKFNEKEFKSYLNMILENNLLDINFNVKGIDKIISLCTCSNDSNDERLIIVGKVL